MNPSLDPEVTSLVLLYKAFVQQRFKLQSEISLQYITSNFYKYNTNWRYYLEIIPKIKHLKLLFLNFSRHMKKFDQNNRMSPIDQNILSKVLNDYNRIHSSLNSIEKNQGQETQTHKLKALQYSLQEKKAKLDQLRSIFQLNQKNLKLFPSKKHKVSEIKEKVHSLRLSIQKYKSLANDLKGKGLSCEDFFAKEVKNVQSFGKLNKKRLELKSKILLRNDLKRVVVNAKAAYEKFIHFAKLEKRRLQKLNHLELENEGSGKKLSDLVQTRACSLSKEIQLAEIDKHFRCISPIKMQIISCPSDISEFVEVEKSFDGEIDDIMSDCISRGNLLLKEELNKLHSRVHLFENKTVDIN